MMAVAATLPQSAPAPRPVVEAPAMPPPAPQAAAAPVAEPEAHPHKAKPKAKARTVKRHQAVVERKQFAEVFKRCPPLGEPGALRCRHDICNGAERQGAACKPYRGKLP